MQETSSTHNQPSWQELASSVRHGNMRSFTVMIERVQPVCEEVFNDLQRHDKDDLLQEVVIRMARLVHGPRPEEDWLPYLRGVARNVKKKWLKTRKEEVSLSEDMAYIDTSLDKREVYTTLHQVMLSELTAEELDMIRMRFWSDKDHTTIGREFGVSGQHARRRIDGALRKLKPKLIEAGIDSAAPWQKEV